MQDTTRVTLRIPEADLDALDMIIKTGEYADRSEAIRRAIKDFVNNRAGEVKKAYEARKDLQNTFLELENLKQQIEASKSQLEKLMRK